MLSITEAAEEKERIKSSQNDDNNTDKINNIAIASILNENDFITPLPSQVELKDTYKVEESPRIETMINLLKDLESR